MKNQKTSDTNTSKKNKSAAGTGATKMPLWLILTIAAAVLLAVLIPTIIYATRDKGPKAPVAAFYLVPENQQQAITQVLAEYSPELTYITYDHYPTEKEFAQISLFFSPIGQATQRSQYRAQAISPSVFSQLPERIASSCLTKNGEYKTLPLIMDYFEADFYSTYRKDNGLEIPMTLEDLQLYLAESKQMAPVDSVCAGADDRELLDFISSLSLSTMGAASYRQMLTQISAEKDFPPELISVLDYTRGLMDSELLSPHWTKLTASDIEFYMKEHQLALIYMNLSEHRTKPGYLIKYYETSIVPPSQNVTDAGIITTTTAVQLLSKKFYDEEVLNYLLSDQVQADFSQQTTLSPVSSRAESYDSQADDGRYYAAAIRSGPLPSIAQACCITKEEQSVLAQNIRDYLNK